MAIPPVQPFSQQPGGGLVAAMQGMNALTASNLANQIESVKAQYAPQMTAADLAYKQLQNKFYTPDILSQINNRNALTQGYNIANEYAPEKLRQANELARLTNQNYVQNIQSEINSRNALTNKTIQMTPLEVEKQRITNKFLPESEKARIAYQNMGGGRGGLGVGAKDDLIFQKSIATDNPTFNENDARIAANLVSQGENTMPDGRAINYSPASKRAYDRALKSTTTSPILTQGIKANQAEAELKVLNDYAQKGLQPYGNTYMNKSPQQIVDSFKSDDKSQVRLGRLIAAQALGYEAAQNRIRLANGQPGVTSTEELMKLSGQQISTNYPMLSYKARKEAARYMDEALSKGLEARRSVGIGASSVLPKNKENQSSQAPLPWPENKPAKNEKEVEGKKPPKDTKWMISPDGLKVPVHKDKATYAIKELGFREVK